MAPPGRASPAPARRSCTKGTPISTTRSDQAGGGLPAAFLDALGFDLDPFQLRACAALGSGTGVLVCAPTGAGKTVVGEYAVHLALETGGKCFYTTPIKALSNQKFADLRARHGEDAVGLLTGDQSINPHAPIVVMTTEVLRNMLYAQSAALTGLSHVVLDEVHFLADRARGAVWEEVILGLPLDVKVVGLSATVSNSEEFGAWIQTVRGDTDVIVDELRPVPLWQHVFVDGSLFPLFESTGDDRGRRTDGDGRARAIPASGKNVVVSTVLRREIRRALGPRNDREPGNAGRGRREDRRGGHPRRGGRRHGRGTEGRTGDRSRPADRGRRRTRAPSRPQVIAALEREGLLPAISFIFSRAGCDGAVDQCRRSGLRLTDDSDEAAIREVIDRHTAALPAADLDTLGFDAWAQALLRGFAAHHAGLLPAFRHAVEELFVRGFIRVVFATETLALGINMPARTVLLEKLVKFNGETHADLTPGEYTQLTGRAGRRGIDVEGHAVVVWRPGLDVDALAGLAGTRTYPLNSSFAPAYNMTVNLVHRLGVDAGRALVEQSFAQFQSDRSVVGLARSIEKNREALDGYAQNLDCHLGDFREYLDLRGRITARERELEKATRAARRRDTIEQLGDLRRGTVIAVPAGKRAGVAVVLSAADDPADPRPLVLTEDRWAGRLSAPDFRGGVDVLGSMRLPRHVAHQSPSVRRDLASALRATGLTPQPTRRKRSAARDDAELAQLRKALRAHPCHRCPERDTHERWGERYRALEDQTDRLIERHNAASHSLARRFDRMVRLLTEFGYLAEPASRDDPSAVPEPARGVPPETADRPGAAPTMTERGRLLAGIHSESALLVTESLHRRAWVGLAPAELSAVAAALVYESRGRGWSGTPPESPTVADAIDDADELWDELRTAEARHRLPITRRPDDGFSEAIFRWARGCELDEALYCGGDAHGRPLAAGDFVRWCRQVVDLLDQIAAVTDDRRLARRARSATEAIQRGVVAIGEA